MNFILIAFVLLAITNFNLDSISGEDYNSVNYANFNETNDLINKIIDENGKKFSIVMDVGCGSGDLTQLLSQKLSFDKIIAIDIDNEMFTFAQTNYTSPKIKYLDEDISVDWEQLSPVLKELEGKVSLIFTNRALHFIENKRNAALNLYRFLTPNGKLYANIGIVLDISQKLRQNEKNKIRKLYRIPTVDNQIEMWTNAFRDLGVKDIKYELLDYELICPKDVFEKRVMQSFLSFNRQYLLREEYKYNKTMISELKSIVTNPVIKTYCKEVGIGTNGIPLFKVTYPICRFVAIK